MTTSGGRKTISYLVKCALQSGDSLVKQDQNSTNYTFAGGLGLCPNWKNYDVHSDGACMEAVSACMMAHVNTAGVHVPLWLDSLDSAIGWGIDRTNYPMQEGTFFGDIIDTGPLTTISKPGVTAPVAYFCDGAGYPSGASGIVAGRLGAYQSGAPYMNPFSTSLCQNTSAVGHYSYGITGSCPSGSNANPSTGCPDGYQALYTSGGTWQHGITVWRNNSYNPQFDTAYTYRLMPYSAYGGQSVDVTGGSTSNGTLIEQWATWNGAPQMFNLVQDGSSWRIALSTNTAKCIDLVGGGSSLADGTQLAVNDCHAGDSSQQWAISPDAQTGAFIFKNVQAGRCLDVPSGSTASGARLQIWDCWNGSPQKYTVQAIPLN
jgi:hypothetical protein